MGKLIDLTGKKFGKLTVIKKNGSSRNYISMWLCRCECGNEVVIRSDHLRNGSSKSCGCFQREKSKEANTKHGCCYERVYNSWRGMKERCYNEKNSEYKHYGGKGVKVCSEWQEFIPFYQWALANGYAENLTIDRIDNDGNYEPSNCRWATNKEQQNNKSNNRLITYKGETKTLAQWAETTGIAYYTLWHRINKYHWSIEEAFTGTRKDKTK